MAGRGAGAGGESSPQKRAASSGARQWHQPQRLQSALRDASLPRLEPGCAPEKRAWTWR